MPTQTDFFAPDAPPCDLPNGVQAADQLFDRFCLQFRPAGDGFVHIVDISGVVFVMMDFHRERIQVRLKRLFGIREGGYISIFVYISKHYVRRNY